MKESQEDVAHSCDTNIAHLKATKDSDPLWWKKQDESIIHLAFYGFG